MLTREFLKSRYLILPCRGSLTLTPQNPTAGAITVANCTDGNWTQEEVNSLGGALAFNTERKAFTLPEAELAGNVPREGWLITDADGNAWTIKSVVRWLQDTMFRCLVTKNVS